MTCRYSDEEDRIIISMFGEGRSDEDISEKLPNRSADSVRIHRCKVLKLKNHINNPLYTIMENQRKLKGVI